MSTLILKNLYWRKKCQKKLLTRTSLARNLLKYCAKLIDFIKNIISNENFINQHKVNNSDFTRKRSLPFPTVFIFLLNLLRSSLQNELDKFFQTIDKTDVATRTVTASAFCQARKKLKYSAFIELLHKSSDYFYKLFSTKRWNGFRLLAVDGSTVQVPKNEETEEHFGVWHPAKTQDTCPVARVSQMFDVLNHVDVDAIIAPKSQGERALALKHFEYLKKNDLVLLDRGYPAFWLFQLIVKKGADFCARLPIDKWTQSIKSFLDSNLKEQVIELKPNYIAKKKCIELGLPTTPIKVRLIRIELDSGELEILATTLIDCNLYPYDVFKDLYFKRWPVEEQYKLLKSRIEIANFTGKSVQAVMQDFYARVFMCNLTSMLAFPVHDKIIEKHEQSKLDYKINWTQALAKMKNSAILLFFRDNIISIIKKLFKLFLADNSAVRPGRKFPRKMRICRKKYAFPYKPIS